jgi:hypothetical protein
MWSSCSGRRGLTREYRDYALHASVVAAGYRPDTTPRNAEWGERFFHLTDLDGHELSFAWSLRP